MRSHPPIAVGTLLVIVGCALAALPKLWIEGTIGFEPDSGNGLFELIIAVAPIILGAALVLRGVLRRHRSHDVATAPRT